ncbi:MAG: GtrA family protein [Pseudomonadota bacterium]
MPIQFLFYCFIGGVCAVVNLLLFLSLHSAGFDLTVSTIAAFALSAILNYYLSIKLIFRHRARWKTAGEVLAFFGVVVVVGAFDLYSTRWLVAVGLAPWLAKLIATAFGLVLNFTGRRFIVFPESGRPDWKPQNPDSRKH